MTAMRFGHFIPQGWRLDLVGIDPVQHWTTMRTLAQRADRGRWDSIWVYDHFHTTPKPTDQATHEAWSLMAAFAAVTDRIRLGQMCTCMSYRNPMYLAKIAGTSDAISGGRVEMGIGAGWYEHEWRAYGYGFPDAPERLRMLNEGVQIMKQAWETGKATFSGKHYTVDGALCYPRPLQPGGIPLWIAGGGEKVTLRIAAKYAQYTNFDATSIDSFRHKSQILQQHCANVGTDFGLITRSSNFNVVIGATAAEVEDRLARLDDRVRPHIGKEAAERMIAAVRQSPATGTPEQIIDRLSALADIGMTYAIGYFAEAAFDTSGLEMFETEVIPALSK